MWECGRPLLLHERSGDFLGLSDLDTADSGRGEVDVAEETKDGAIGGFWVGWDVSFVEGF
jgi:hypothetical protein